MTNNNRNVRRITLVLADDQVIVRQSIRKLLQKRKEYKIIGEATDGEEVLGQVTIMHPDVLITDLRMPKSQGIDIILKVKRYSPKTKVIVFSVHEEKAYVYSAFVAGADGYVIKNTKIHNLNDAINNVVEGKKYICPPLTEKSLELYCLKRGKRSFRQIKIGSEKK